MDIASLPEGHYIPDGNGSWKLKQAYHYKQAPNGEWYRQGKNDYRREEAHEKADTEAG